MTEDDLIADLGALSGDPYRFVLWAFPWGEGPLTDRAGPEPWQEEILKSIRDGLTTPEKAIREATVSGNGIGKSALVSWLILWCMSRPDTKGVITANTEAQLKTKTWPELGKWYQLYIAKSLFELEATAIFSKDPAHRLTWRGDAIPWSQYNAVAFQGLHNENKRLFMIFDEASGIDDVIWEAADGCMTDLTAERIWAVFGNPNSPTGRFRECFPGGRFAHRWKTRKIDARTVSFTDKAEYQRWVDDYGEDHDFVRVRVRGEFPRTGSLQFIGTDAVSGAASPTREVHVGFYDPFVMGVDVARFGDDKSVICFRRGRDARSVPWIKLRQIDTQTLALRVVELYLHHKPDAIFVDGGGVGGGVVDRLREMKCPVYDIQFGAKSDALAIKGDAFVYANKRAEIWGMMREWLSYGIIPDDPDLISGLMAVQYGYTMKEGREAILLEKKDDMKRRGLASPDEADALALTFSYPIAPSDHSQSMRQAPMHTFDYNPMSRAFQLETASNGRF